MSAVLGFTGGVLLATIAFEMLPGALEHSSLTLVILGFVMGFVAVYAFDLIVHGGVLVRERVHGSLASPRSLSCSIAQISGEQKATNMHASSERDS